MNVSSDSATPPEVAEVLKHRIRVTQLSFLGCFVFTLCLNVLLSHFADPKSGDNATSYGVDNNLDGNYTISHSMTGLYSKVFALLFIFLSNLYYFSISHYQFAVYRVLHRYLLTENQITKEEARKMWRINALAYGIATWSAVFLMCLTIFDAQRFNSAHLTFAGLFFLFCLVYVVLMERNDLPLVELGLSKGMAFFNKVMFAGAMFFMVVFICGSVWDGKEIKDGHGTENRGKWAKRLCAVGEYGYMIFCVIIVSSRAYAREHLLEKYDFSELLNVQVFSIRTLLIDCFSGMDMLYIFGYDPKLSQNAMAQVDHQMQRNSIATQV